MMHRIDEKGTTMEPSFETYAMRGLVAVLAGIVGMFFWREIRGKDAIWKVVHQNRLDHEAALKEARDAFAKALERVTNQFRMSIDSLNTAIASLSTTVAKLDGTMAREYATKDDLRDMKEDLRVELSCHADNCPIKARLEAMR